ncbi:MAG: hypothetical protein K0S08_2144 [Gammaproteobacteria bacterium]|jgi:hypothetical protein|nr:hypothetical protein [Gammaproteobacteria bacterium]
MNKTILLSSANELTLADRRLYNYLLHHAIHEIKKKLKFNVKFEELKGVYTIGLPLEDRLKESLRRLLRTLIEFEPTPGQWVVFPLLEHAKVEENKLYYAYSPYCQQIFTDPFTLERCLIQAHFQQKYSNLLYEILAGAFYAGLSSFSIEVPDLRSRLKISETKLPNFGDFDRFALSPALTEMNTYASFAVKFHTQRRGMKVTHVIFEMQEKRNISANTDPKSVIPPKRPRFFIDDPELERGYAFLLNAETTERRKYFELAKKRAAKVKKSIDEENFDRPDLWLDWIKHDLISRKS